MFSYLDDMYKNYGNKINQMHALLEHLAMQVVGCLLYNRRFHRVIMRRSWIYFRHASGQIRRHHQPRHCARDPILATLE